MKNLQNQEKSISDLLYLDYIKQWTAHVKVNLDHLLDILLQFSKIIENARERKVHPAPITNNQLQEIITELHKEII